MVLINKCRFMCTSIIYESWRDAREEIIRIIKQQIPLGWTVKFREGETWIHFSRILQINYPNKLLVFI